jgi:hypothetical protein
MREFQRAMSKRLTDAINHRGRGKKASSGVEQKLPLDPEEKMGWRLPRLDWAWE